MKRHKIVHLICIVVLFFFCSCTAEKEKPKTSAAEGIENLIDEKGIEEAVAKYQEWKSDPSGKYEFDESEFNSLGYRLRYKSLLQESLAVFKLAVDAFPNSSNAWDSLGEGYIYADDREHAIESYEKSLELNPENDNAKWQLERMDAELVDARGETKQTLRLSSGEQTGLKGPYLGQKPPGLVPKVFAPGIISTRGGHEFSCTFSPDGKEFHFNRGPNIWVCRWEEEGWTAPAMASFNSSYLDHEPHITADGKKLFFGTGRPQPPSEEPSYGIWVMEKEGDQWGEPKYHGPGMYVTTTTDGTIYVTDTSNPEDWGMIVRSRLVDGIYGEFELLGGGINTSYHDAHPCIAPDESFLIFDSDRPGALGGEADNDLYISFRNADGSWGEAVQLKDLSTQGDNMTAYLSPDGKFLFYYAYHDIYWVSSDILKKYKKN
jgi:Tol biopolymer transport system component